jgi:hypothetical protein
MVGPSFLAACGGDGGDGNADAAVDVDASVVADAGVADCPGVTVEPVPELPDGEPGPFRVLFSPDAAADTVLADNDIKAFTAEFLFSSLRDGVWSEPELVADGIAGLGWSMVVAADGTRHVVVAIRTMTVQLGDVGDLYYTRRSPGSGWTELVNLTARFESDVGREPIHPSIALGPGGVLAASYTSRFPVGGADHRGHRRSGRHPSRRDGGRPHRGHRGRAVRDQVPRGDVDEPLARFRLDSGGGRARAVRIGPVPLHGSGSRRPLQRARHASAHRGPLSARLTRRSRLRGGGAPRRARAPRGRTARARPASAGTRFRRDGAGR